MIEIPNSFDLMTNMHHTNPQLLEINSLNLQNVQLKKSNVMWKLAFIGLILTSLIVIYETNYRTKSNNKPD